MQDFRQLQVWQRGHHLVLAVYQISSSFPDDERFGLTSQIRRASSSIPTNIAEGCGRQGDTELARFLQIAMGSASEVEYLLLLARDLDYLENEDYIRLDQQTVEIKRMLSGFIKRLRV
jgi:four helix bundle protein